MNSTYVAQPITGSIGRLARSAAGRVQPTLADDEMLALARSAIGIPMLWATMLGAFGYGMNGGGLLDTVVNTTASVMFVGVCQSLIVPLMILPLRGLRAAGFEDADALMEAGLVMAAGGGLVAANAVFAYPFSRELMLAIGAASIIYSFGVSIGRYGLLRRDAPTIVQIVRLTTPFMAGPLWFVATTVTLTVIDFFGLGRGIMALATAMLT